MAETHQLFTPINPKNGYCSLTKTYHSIRETFPLPPESTPLSITDYVFSLLHSNPKFSPSSPVLIDSSTHTSLSYSDFINRVNSLSSSLSSHLSQNDVALILSPPSFHVPVLYLSLLSLGVVISPVNPFSTQSELWHLIEINKPTIIFTVSSLRENLTFCKSDISIVSLDSPLFDSMLSRAGGGGGVTRTRASVRQSNSGVILFSSGTTGRVKGVELTHRNFIALLATLNHRRIKAMEEEEDENKPPAISLFFLPLFHVFGFFMMLRAVSMAETLVLMERFDFGKMLENVDKYRVTYIPVSPPLIIALEKSELANNYDLSSLELLACGGAPLGKEIAQRFKARFPNVGIVQGYAMTETGGGAASTVGPEECEQYGSVGRLQEYMQAKIVDPSTGEALPPGHEGELWLKGPTIMKEDDYKVKDSSERSEAD